MNILVLRQLPKAPARTEIALASRKAASRKEAVLACGKMPLVYWPS
jgi:hypothetical protein